MAVSNKADDWRSDCNDVDWMRIKARAEARFTDIQFVVGSGNSIKVFHAHKLILAFGSPVFEKMFYGSLAEKRSVIETDDDPEAFDMLLNYLYGKEKEIKSVVSAWKYFTICDKYLIPKMPDKAREYIKNASLSDDAFWGIIENNIFASPLLEDKVNFYLMERAYMLVQSAKFLDMPEVVIEKIIQMDKLNAQEYQLLLAITKWAYHKSNQILSKNLINYYKHIRFSTLTSNELFQFIDLFPKALDAESYLEILRHLNNPSRCNLPKWCSTSKASRIKELQNYQNKMKEISEHHIRNRTKKYGPHKADYLWCGS